MSGSGYFLLLLFSGVLFSVGLRAQILIMCEDQIEQDTCEILCITPNNTETVAFFKIPDTANEIGQCVPTLGCIASSPYTITQPNSTTTALRFELTRNIVGQYRCSYGSSYDEEPLKWGTYPENVTVTGLTNGSEITSVTDFHVMLKCLYSEDNPTVILHYKDEQGDIDAKSDLFSCTNLPSTDCLHDGDFSSYQCPCKLRKKTGIVCNDLYDVNGLITIANIRTTYDRSIVDDINFLCTTTSATTTSRTTTTRPTSHQNKCLHFIAAKSCGLTYFYFVLLVVCLLSPVPIGCLIKWKRKHRHKHQGNLSDLGKGITINNSNTQEMHTPNI